MIFVFSQINYYYSPLIIKSIDKYLIAINTHKPQNHTKSFAFCLISLLKNYWPNQLTWRAAHLLNANKRHVDIVIHTLLFINRGQLQFSFWTMFPIFYEHVIIKAKEDLRK